MIELSQYISIIVITMHSFFTLKQSQKSMQLITKNSATLKTTGCCPFLCMATHCYRISVCVCVLYKIYFVNCPRSSHKDLFCQMMVRHWGILKKPNSNILWYSIKSIQSSCKNYTVYICYSQMKIIFFVIKNNFKLIDFDNTLNG